jgi:hypothetical protein
MYDLENTQEALLKQAKFSLTNFPDKFTFSCVRSVSFP